MARLRRDHAALQFEVVLDDAVVDDGNFAGVIHVRVGVVVDRFTVGRPASVADAGRRSGRGGVADRKSVV